MIDDTKKTKAQLIKELKDNRKRVEKLKSIEIECECVEEAIQG